MSKTKLIILGLVLAGIIYFFKILFDSIGALGIFTAIFCIGLLLGAVYLYNFAKGQSVWQ
jgi:hypothetical protein